MNNLKAFELGVGDLVNFVFRKGSIDTRGSGKSRLQLGTKIHQKIQAHDEKEKEDYQKEVYFKFIHILDEYAFILTGRADAIYKENGKTIIEEIKTTNKFKSKNFKPQFNHQAQLYFYGYFYMVNNNVSSVDLTLHYYHIVSEEETYFRETKTFEELREFINKVLEMWLQIGFLKSEWLEERNKSIDQLTFIHKNFRTGQREISLAVFNTIMRNNKVLIEAPTGIGKTIGTIFPSIKTLLKNSNQQIYYLTAKTTIQSEANKAINQMRDYGLKIKSTTITARDKICFLNQKEENTRNCNPDDCIYAKDYYSKINEILLDCLKSYSNFDRESIERIARDNQVCPYQLSIDLCSWSDIIICDYNYIFDPVSSIEGLQKERICLIDEAHNLPDRSRNMFSAELKLATFVELQKVLLVKNRLTEKENRRLLRQVEKFIKFLESLKLEFYSDNEIHFELTDSILDDINNYIYQFQTSSFRYLSKVKDKKIPLDSEIIAALNECSSSIYRFNIVIEYALIDDNYFNYVFLSKNEVIIKLACLDASKYIEKTLEKNPAVFFSATLTPFDYYKEVLLGKEEIPTIALPSPFDSSHYTVICDDSISTRYADRETSYTNIADLIETVISKKRGNYLIFFPSYNYLHRVYKLFEKNDNINVDKILVQNPGMNETERKEFLDNFKNGNSIIGFCVMGGIFSEGIDLPLDALIGTIIIGPGIPGIDFERNLIKEYFQRINGNGYAYAYAYPGMNRVLQSAGRVIRTSEDRGVILLIDDRFHNPFYSNMIPDHLKPDYLSNHKDIEKHLQDFWSKNGDD